MPAIIYRRVKGVGIRDHDIHRLVETLLRAVRRPHASLRIHFIGDRRMRRLNALYRGNPRTTDVLSFPLREEGGPVLDRHDWGDVFLSPAYIRRQAASFGVSYREECYRMLIHGMLHLFGYDHERKKDAAVMFGLQERLLRQHV